MTRGHAGTKHPSAPAPPGARRVRLTAGELARKCVHIGVGLLAMLVPFLAWWQGVLVCGVAFLMNWLVLPRLTHHYLEREEDRKRGFAEGILDYPVAVGLLFLLFGSRPAVVAAAWGILAFGDGFATLAGRAIGGPGLPWNRDKSWAGFVAFVAVGGSVACLLTQWVAAHGHPAPPWWIAGSFLAALLGAILESLPTGINDNLSVPLMTGGLLYALSLTDAVLLSDARDELLSRLIWGAAVNLAIAGLTLAAGLVKRSGAVAGFLVGAAIWTFGGWQSFAILMLFFVVATAATKVGYESKAARKIAQEEGGRRGARHAVANCAVPAFMAFMAAATPYHDLFLVALVAALATAVFDTVSSEIGQVYGRTPFLITTFRRVPAGTDGAVSVEGTLAGLGAAALLAAAAAALGMTGAWGWAGAAVAVAAAFIGTTVESYLGAVSLAGGRSPLSRIDNEAMNFINTLVGALAAMALAPLVLS